MTFHQLNGFYVSKQTIFIVFLILTVVFGYLKKRWKTLFVIKIFYRTVKVEKGFPPKGFVNECQEIAKIRKRIKGKIYGIRDGNGINLSFSKTLSEGEKQIFRNAWPNAYLGGNPPPETGNRKRAKR